MTLDAPTPQPNNALQPIAAKTRLRLNADVEAVEKPLLAAAR